MVHWENICQNKLKHSIAIQITEQKFPQNKFEKEKSEKYLNIPKAHDQASHRRSN